MVKPVFSAAAAVTLDGRIAAYRGQGSGWTSKEDKQFLRNFLDQSDVVLVGHTTYQVARKPLSKRNCLVLTSQVRTSFRKNRLALFCNPKSVNIPSLIERLGYRTVAVLGGQKVYNFCLEKRLLDEIFLTIEPVIFGQGLNLFEIDKLFTRKLKLVSLKKLNKQGSILARYKFQN